MNGGGSVTICLIYIYLPCSPQDSESLTEWESTGGPISMFAVSHDNAIFSSQSESSMGNLRIVKGEIYAHTISHDIRCLTPTRPSVCLTQYCYITTDHSII